MWHRRRGADTSSRDGHLFALNTLLAASITVASECAITILHQIPRAFLQCGDIEAAAAEGPAAGTKT
jgi:hypothetical protein